MPNLSWNDGRNGTVTSKCGAAVIWPSSDDGYHFVTLAPSEDPVRLKGTLDDAKGWVKRVMDKEAEMGEFMPEVRV